MHCTKINLLMMLLLRLYCRLPNDECRHGIVGHSYSFSILHFRWLFTVTDGWMMWLVVGCWLYVFGVLMDIEQVVLSACSSYFQKLLLENPCKHPTIILPGDIIFTDLKTIIDFVYRGEIDVTESELQVSVSVSVCVVLLKLDILKIITEQINFIFILKSIFIIFTFCINKRMSSY